jgi:hypothetical protein
MAMHVFFVDVHIVFLLNFLTKMIAEKGEAIKEKGKHIVDSIGNIDICSMEKQYLILVVCQVSSELL